MFRPFFVVALLSSCAPAAFAATNCAALKTADLEDTTIVSADTVRGGALPQIPANLHGKLPGFCRVTGVLHPTADSVIHFEVWLPAMRWNGRILNVGNGGFAGSIGYGQMAANLARGYATAGSDAGHQAEAEDASWAYKHPEKIRDFGYRAVHLTALRSKDLVKAFYGAPQKQAYFDSCSDGGREALMEAQRFPEDYDGILAGAPANNWSHMLAHGLALAQTTTRDPAAYLSAMKLPAIHRASLAACDARDGLKDGVVSDPEHCDFDPAVLQCTGAEDITCLTAPQVTALRAMYAGGGGKPGDGFFPGLLPGDEDPAWHSWVVGNGPGGASGNNYMTGFFRYMVFNDPVWQPLTADPKTALDAAMRRTAADVDSTSADLGAFAGRGGKLVMYHGWNDPAISPWNSIDYLHDVQKTMGPEKADTSVRLYLAPGMEHCAGGPGPNVFGQLGMPGAAGEGSGAMDRLRQWVEAGKAPGPILAAVSTGTGKAVQRTVRPLCPYPQIARYDGTGRPNVPASFACVAP